MLDSETHASMPAAATITVRNASGGTSFTRKMWTNHEIEEIDRVYGCGTPKEEILRLFPGRSWGQIKSMACRMRKTRVRTRKLVSVVHPVVVSLTVQRMHLGWSQALLGEKLGRNRKTINHWERGYRLPAFPELEAWSATLGLRLALAPALPCANESPTNQE